MITESLSGTAYRWGAGGTLTLGNGAANIVYTAGIPLLDVEQLGLVVRPSLVAISVVMRMQFASDQKNYVEEQVEAVGAVVAGAQRYTVYIKEWGPFSTSLAIERPASFHFVKIGIYGTGAADPADFVQLEIERQRTAAQTQPGS